MGRKITVAHADRILGLADEFMEKLAARAQ